MRLDYQALFAEDFATITTADTYESTNAYDLDGTTSPPNFGPGETVKVLIQVTEAFATGTQITFNLISATDAALTGTPTVQATTGAILTAALTLGKQFILTVPVVAIAQRYLGLNMVSTGTYDAGKFTAGIVGDVQTADSGFPAVL